MSSSTSVIEILKGTPLEFDEITDKQWLCLMNVGTHDDETKSSCVDIISKFMTINTGNSEDKDIVYNSWIESIHQNNHELLLQLIESVQEYYDKEFETNVQSVSPESVYYKPKFDVMNHVSVLATGASVELAEHVDCYLKFTKYLLVNIKNNRILTPEAFECVKNTLVSL